MEVLDWLLGGDAAVRYQTLRDLTDADDETVAAARACVTCEGWGAAILAARDEDGQWAGGACFPADFRGDFSRGQPWTSTLPVLGILRELGADPEAPVVVETMRLVAANCRWEYDGSPFFDGEVEPCINGRLVAIGAWAGRDVRGVVERLLREQLPDGGWNCEAENGSVVSSFDTTICVVEGLAAYERARADDPEAFLLETSDARGRGEEYLIARGLFRRLSTGDIVDERYLAFPYPFHWHHDVLRGLDHLRSVGARRDARLAEAVELVRSRRGEDGTWPLDPGYPGATVLDLESDVGTPCRIATLRALRVLAWWDEGGASGSLEASGASGASGAPGAPGAPGVPGVSGPSRGAV